MGLLSPAAKAAHNAQTAVYNAVHQLETSGVNGYNFVWNSGSDPAQVLSYFGPQAETVMALAQLLVSVKQQIAEITGDNVSATSPLPSNVTNVLFNADGSFKQIVYASSSSSGTSSSSSGS